MAAKPKLSAKEKQKIRRSLAREVRRNPASVMTRKFARKAILVDFKLPLTVRLGRATGNGTYEPSDDELEITYDDSANVWPLTDGVPPAVTSTLLSGKFTLEASMGEDAAGYGELGAMETRQGASIKMSAQPFAISDFPGCGPGTQLATDPNAQVQISSAGVRFGVMNLFSQTIRGSLYLRSTFASARTDVCGGTTQLTPTVDNINAPPMPVRYDGVFRLSPSITADGKLRFGRITIDDAVSPQTSSFTYIRACTGVMTCDPEQFPARLKIKKLTAEVIVGDNIS